MYADEGAAMVARVNANNTLIDIFDASGHMPALLVMLQDSGSAVTAVTTADLTPHFMLMPMVAAHHARLDNDRHGAGPSNSIYPV